jgi:hypothetical protein
MEGVEIKSLYMQRVPKSPRRFGARDSPPPGASGQTAQESPVAGISFPLPGLSKNKRSKTMNNPKKPKPHNPYHYMLGPLHDRHEEITDGFRYETYRHCNSNPSHSARLRVANDANEKHMWQVVTDEYKIHYFDFYKDAMAFLYKNGYIPLPKRANNFHYWPSK